MTMIFIAHQLRRSDDPMSDGGMQESAGDQASQAQVEDVSPEMREKRSRPQDLEDDWDYDDVRQEMVRIINKPRFDMFNPSEELDESHLAELHDSRSTEAILPGKNTTVINDNWRGSGQHPGL